MEFLRVVCVCNEVGVAASQEKVHENMFYFPESYDKVIIPTSIDNEKKSLNVLLKHDSGVGENYVIFNDCFFEGKIILYTTEIEYFTKLIGVFSALCKGRNYICKTSISNWFPLHFLLESIWNENFTVELRANFLELLIAMHIDFQPRYFIQKPDLIRTLEKQDDLLYVTNFRERHRFSNIESGLDLIRKVKTIINKRRASVSGSTLSRKNTNQPGKFILIGDEEYQMFQLKCNLITQLEGETPGKFDAFVLQMLKLSRLFIQFELITMEVSDLDQRKCFLSQSEQFKPERIDIYRLLKAIQVLFFGQPPKQNIRMSQVMKNQTLIMEKSQATVKKFNQKLQFDFSEEPFANYLEGIQNYLQFKANQNLESDKVNFFEIQCKLEYCKIINLLINLRQEMTLNDFIEKLETERLNKAELSNWIMNNIKTPKKVEKGRSLSEIDPKIFDPIANVKIDPINDLLRMFHSTNNYKLKSETLGIILKVFSQTRDFMKAIKKVKIMRDLSNSDLVLWCKINIMTFKSLSEQSEIVCKYWMQSSNISDRNAEKLIALSELLENFRAIMSSDCRLEGEELISYNTGVDSGRQIMLKNLKFHVYVTNIIKDCMYILEEIFDNQKNAKEKEAKNRLTSLFNKCFKCLQKFSLNCPTNQHALFPYLNVFTSNLRIQLGQIDLLCDMFRDNSELCTLLTENTLQLFTNLIQTEGRQADFLNFFDVVTEVKGIGIQNIQRIVLMLLTDSDFEDQLCYMGKDKKFEFSLNPDPPSASYVDQPIAYHSKLISVLTKCGSSTTAFYLTNAKCQKIIPLPNVFELLARPPDQSLEKPLLDFLIQIYLESYSEGDDSETYSGELSKILAIKTKQLEPDTSLESRTTRECLEKWVKVLHLYLKNKILKNVDFHKMKIQLYLNAVIKDLNERKNQKFSNSFKTQLIELCNGFDVVEPESIEIEEVFEIQTRATTEKESQWDDTLRVFESSDFKKNKKQERIDFLLAIQAWTGQVGDNQQLIESFIEFLSKAKVVKPPVRVLYQVIKFLGEYINGTSEVEDVEKRKANQNHYRTCRIVPIVLDLMCDKEIDRRIFSILVKFCVTLLNGGNYDMQHDFYSYFSIFSSSEHFFFTLNSIITQHVSLFALNKENNTLNFTLKKSNKLVNNIIKLLQLFCENHFELLQNYIRVQDKSHNNYDLVVTVISLLQELMRSKRKQDFFIISHCFEMLTECIQGPCRMNQKAIIDSKFLEIAGDLLSIDEDSELLQVYLAIKDVSKESEVIKSPSQNLDNSKLLKCWMISQLKYKCMITLMGLLEGQTDSYILVRMARTFNLQIFRQNLISIYNFHSENLKYSKELFNDFNKNKIWSLAHEENTQEEKKFKFLIEVGFLIYFLLKYFINIEDQEIKKLLENDIPEFVELSQILKDEYSKPQTTNKISFSDFVSKNENEQNRPLYRALGFFEDNTANVEVVFQGVLCVTYFWLPPVCHHLTYETMEEFRSRVDRSSDKKKVEFLVSQAYEIIEDMRYEEWLSTVYGYKLIGQHVRKVKFVAFLLSIVLNILILLSYNSFLGDRFYKPSLGRYEDNYPGKLSKTETENVILGLGIIQAILSGLIFFFFIIKTAPMLIQRLWKQQDQKVSENSSSDSSSIKTNKIFQTILYTLLNFDVLYHFFYFSFSILAITLHPFYYSAHLLDIMYRFPSLQGVVKSIVVPWRQLLLTLVFIIVIVYLFSVWAYFRLQDDFVAVSGGEVLDYVPNICNSLFFCFINVFDKGIKNYGGFGLWLDYTSAPVPGEVDIERFIFDNIFVVIIWFIMLNIVQGIIYVTFAIVREKDERNENDIQNICFICGKEKEIVERITERTFAYHRLMEHNEWNYIFFIAYLTFKEPTEHSGIESFVSALNNNKKIDWIPQQQCLSFLIKEKREEDFVQQGIIHAQEMLSKYQRVLIRIRKGLEGRESNV